MLKYHSDTTQTRNNDHANFCPRAGVEPTPVASQPTHPLYHGGRLYVTFDLALRSRRSHIKTVDNIRASITAFQYLIN